MIVFEWINDNIFKLKWLDDLIKWLFETVFGLDPSSMTFSALTFFIYDVIKIFLLLSILIFISSYIQSYFSPERTRKILGRFRGIWANIIGALLGTVTPFCSCSSIPIFIGFTKAGLPLGVTFSFLISSPLVDLASVVLLASVFNWRIALAYVIVGLLIAVIGGTIIGSLKMERYVESFALPDSNSMPINGDQDETKLRFKQRAAYAVEQVLLIIKKVWIYILIGVGIGAIIHGFIPQTLIEAVLGSRNPFSVVIATIIGIPMYADIFGTLPIAEALVGKGVGVGTVLAFMMAVTALSLPSLIMLKKVIKKELLLTFVAIVVIGILVMGYLFDIFGFIFI
ncbi:MAG TPA: permease [Bacilli bacterium]|nr:permease [Bacilli bacterium]